MAFRASVVGIGVALAIPFSFLGCAAAGVAGDCKATVVDAESRTLAEKECGKCHPLQRDVPSFQVGPNIAGVFGVKAAQRADYSRYSEAMKLAATKGLTWDEATLSAYITDPGAFLGSVSGQSEAKHGMFYKMPDKDKRKRIVAYFKASAECPGSLALP